MTSKRTIKDLEGNVAAIDKGKKRTIDGVRVYLNADGDYSVMVGDATQRYASPRNVARVIKAGKHLTETPTAQREQAAEPKPKSRKAEAKRELATQIVLAIGALVAQVQDANVADDGPFALIRAEFDADQIAAMASLWVHHLPADRERWVTVLPAPDRSDWRTPVTPAAEPTPAEPEPEAPAAE